MDSDAIDPGSGAGDLDLYRFFAFLFGPPSADRFAWLGRSECAAFLRLLWLEFDDSEPPAFSAYGSYAAYESAYMALFEVGMPGPPVPLQESAHDTATPPPVTLLENIAFYRLLGLEVNRVRFAPDHLVTQLEFLAALRYARDRAQDAEGVARLAHAERDFLDRHVLNWLPLAQAKLADAECGPFGPLATLLTRFARFERSALEVATAHVPGAERPLSHAVSLRS